MSYDCDGMMMMRRKIITSIWKVAFADKRKTRCHSSFNLILNTNYYQCLIKTNISKAGFVSFFAYWHARSIHKCTHTLAPFVRSRFEFLEIGLLSFGWMLDCISSFDLNFASCVGIRDCGEIVRSFYAYIASMYLLIHYLCINI